MADAATVDPFTANGWTTTPKAGLSPVIDVGGSTNIDPAAVPGTPGSGMIPSQVGGPPATSVAPTPVPVDRKRNFQEAMSNLLGDPLPPVATPSAPVAAPRPAAKPNPHDPFSANGWDAAPVAPIPSVPAPPASPPSKGSGNLVNAAAGYLEGFGGAGDIVTMPIIGGINTILKTAGLPELPSNAETAHWLMSKLTPDPTTQGENVARAAGRGVGSLMVPAGVAGRVAKMTEGAVPELIQGLAKSAGPGGVISGAAAGAGGELAKEAAPEPYKPLAEMGGNLVAGAVGALPAAALHSAWNAVRPLVRSGTVTNETAGRVLLDQTGGVVPHFDESPTPGAPLNIAQATGNPELASLVDARSAGAGLPDYKREITAQNQALLAQAPRSEGAANAPSPANAAGVASTVATRAIQRGAEIIGHEEKRAWNTPSMKEPKISSSHIQSVVRNELQKLQADEPSLADAIGNSGLMQRVLRDMDDFPVKAAANQINSIASRFREIARTPGEDGRVRVAAGRLGNAAREGIWDAPEVAGRPARDIPATTEQHMMPDGTMETVNIGARHTPPIPPDKTLQNDLRYAIGVTKREAQTIGHASFDNILNRNSRGNETVNPGNSLNRFFDFSTGQERPGDIRNQERFLNDIRSEWLKLNHSAGEYDPTTIARVQDDLLKNTRDYFISKMLGGITGKVMDMNQDRRIQSNSAVQWLRTNKDMAERSGLFTKDQIDALAHMQRTSELIARGDELGKPVGSPTYSRLTSDKKFLDLFMGPTTAMASGAAIGGILGGTVGHLVGEGNLGAILGAEGGATVGLGAGILQRVYSSPREAVLKKLDEAIRNPEIAKDLMKSAASRPKISPATKAWMRSFLSIPPSDAMSIPQGAPT